MRLSHFVADSQTLRSSNQPTPSLNTRYHKNNQQKLFTQESSPTRTICYPKRITESLNKDSNNLSEPYHSEVLVGHAESSWANEQNSVFAGKYVSSREADFNFKNYKEPGGEMLAKRSVQILISMNKGINRTQYSKISRRKQEVIKKNAVLDSNEKIEVPIHKTSEISEEKLIQKYRELMLKKDTGSKPFNMISKLYQIELLTAKEAVLMPKDAIRAVSSKLNQPKSTNQIEFKVNKIIQKPLEINKVRQMLMSHSQKDIPKESNRKEDRPILIKKLPSQEIPSQPKLNVSIRRQLKTQNSEKTQASCRISELRVKAQMSQKIQAISTNSSPMKNEIQLYPPPKKVTSTAYIVYELPNYFEKRPTTRKGQFQSIKKRDYPGQIHASLNIKATSEIASLTKIMTCIVVIETCEKFSINAHLQKYKIGYFQSFIKGTSAEIEPGEIYTIHQLLMGLMLPSGNDASLALARWTGNILLITDIGSEKRSQSKIQTDPEVWASSNKYLRHKQQKLKPKRCYNRFLAEMNKKARLLGLQRTTYINSHGLSNPHNKSCCIDLALLCEYALKNRYFCEIVACKEFEATIEKEVISLSPHPKSMIAKEKRKSNQQDPQQMNLLEDAEDAQQWNKTETSDSNDQAEEEHQNQIFQSQSSIQSRIDPPASNKKVEVSKKQIKWVNTHKLLHGKKEYFGIKTGVTVTAGPCLASCVKLASRTFIIVVLNAKKLSQRFVDTQILRIWVSKKQKLCQGQSVLEKREQQ